MTSPSPQVESLTAPAHTWSQEIIALFRLGWPLIIAQLAHNALLTTDVIMLGWLGPQYLAASTLSIALLNPILLFGVGVVGAVAPLVAQARGARDLRSVRRTLRQGLWISILLSALLIPIALQVRPILSALGQQPDIIALSQDYMQIAAFMIFPSLLLVALRSFLSAFGSTRVILLITVGGVLINILSNYALIFGNFGFPRLELRGAAISIVLINFVMFGLMLAYVMVHKHYRRYHILARFWRPDWARFRKIFFIGAPIGLTIMSEVGMFGVAAVFMGWLGTNEIAAHAVAMQCASIAFMVPLGLSQATTVRVGLAYGRRSGEGVRKAGYVSFAMTIAYMSISCLLFLLVPTLLVGVFLDIHAPENAIPLRLAASYLIVAALFQLVDGTQVIAAASLRGLSDTTMPMLVAMLGYWIIGLPVGYLLGFIVGMRGVGIWLGLACGLAIVAVVLATRFALRERLGLLPATSPLTQ